MKIGFDFDNTIVDYTGVFYDVAKELNWLPESNARGKKSVRQYFIERDKESKWTELQGIVYGKEIFRASPYKDCVETMCALKKAGHELVIISHKTRYPIIGERVCFHEAARNWLRHFGIVGCDNAPVSNEHIYFNDTKQQKVQRITEENCEAFIDDLPEILANPDFPPKCKRILFDPDKKENESVLNPLSSWRELPELL